MAILTHKQDELHRFIAAFMAASGGIAPTFDEMAQGVSLRSKSGVHRMIDGLVERGYIHRLKHRNRAIELLKQPAGVCPTCGRGAD